MTSKENSQKQKYGRGAHGKRTTQAFKGTGTSSTKFCFTAFQYSPK